MVPTQRRSCPCCFNLLKNVRLPSPLARRPADRRLVAARSGTDSRRFKFAWPAPRAITCTSALLREC
eukprot:1978799-Pleurochrysis_carterae.AAC.1